MQKIAQKSIQNSTRQAYPSNLTESEWALIEACIPPRSSSKKGGRKRTTNMREVCNAILYLIRSKCSWRMLPHDFPKKEIVRHYFDTWKKDGTFRKMYEMVSRTER